MKELKNKLGIRILIFTIIVSVLFWLMPANLIMGNDEPLDGGQTVSEGQGSSGDVQPPPAEDEQPPPAEDEQPPVESEEQIEEPAAEEILSASLNIAANPSVVKPGESVIFKIVVKNTGNVVLENLKVVDKLLAIVIFEPIEGFQFNEELKEVSYTIGSIAPDEISVKEIIVGVPVVVNEEVILTNIVSVSSEKINTIEEKVDITFEATIVEETKEEESIGEEELKNETKDLEEQYHYNPFIYTDKEDYHPGEEVTLFGEGFVAGEEVQIIFYAITDEIPDGEIEHVGIVDDVGEDGTFVYKYNIIGADRYRVEARTVVKNDDGSTTKLESDSTEIEVQENDLNYALIGILGILLAWTEFTDTITGYPDTCNSKVSPTLAEIVKDYFTSPPPDPWKAKDPDPSKLPHPIGCNLISFKIDLNQDEVVNGQTYGDGTLAVTIYKTADNNYFAFYSNIPVLHVYVKGGSDGGNLYKYYNEFPSGVFDDCGLRQPTGTGGWSHISFYYCQTAVYNVSFNKEFEGTPPSNAEFDIYADDGSGNPTGSSLGHDSLADDGSVDFTGLLPGDYVIVETVTPPGYSTMSNILITIATDGTVTGLPTSSVENNFLEGSVTIHKTNSKNQDIDIMGAVYGLFYSKDTGDPVLDSNGDPLTATTNESGIAVFNNLSLGTYYVKEISAPVGYLVDPIFHQVTIPDPTNGNVDIAMELTNDPVDIYFNKVFTGLTGTLSPAAVFNIYAAADTGFTTPLKPAVILTTAGMVRFSIIPPGSYVIVETTTPSGYVTMPNISVTVGDDGTVNYTSPAALSNGGTVTNSPPPPTTPPPTTPPTIAVAGITTGGGIIEVAGLAFTGVDIRYYIGGFVLILAGLVLSVIFMRKSQKRKGNEVN